VLIAFIGSTTVNVVGLFVLVAKWMYPGDAKGRTDRTQLQVKAASLKKSSKGNKAKDGD
jgi:hypothetical protein